MAPIVSMVGPKTPHGKESNTTSAEVNQNIQVFVRCRPLKPNEKKNAVEVVSDRKEVRINESKSIATDRYNTKTFTFDNTFNCDTPQIEVYRAVVEPLIEQVVMGYNCTVFAYGQTGTGKTYTMEGERSTDDSCSWENDPTCGIIPRALHQLFEILQSQETEHTVRVSFLELYNEELYDLLSAIDDTTKLKIYEDSTRKGSTIVGGLEEITVHSKAEIYDILRKGSSKRQTAATLLNACSSRSHTIFSVTVHIKENTIEGEDLVKIGKLNLVDLAGSENIGRSGAIDKRAREAGNINQSLLTLGRVITCLVDRTPHIPYRESKLTRLLQDSLGGRTKTSIIATISPNILDVEDTLSTLEYAQRAKKITNKPEINQKLSKKTLLREYTAEIERLRRDLAACREKNGIYINQDNFNAMEEQIKSQTEEIENKTAQIQALQDEIVKITNLFDETKEQLDTKTEELEKTSKNLKTTSFELKRTKINLKETQIDRNEQKHLVEVHSSKEKLLTDQAKQLLNIADRTTDDVGRLHAKVDRQKNIEITNKKRTDDFQEKYRNEMLSLEELVNITTTSYQDSINEMQKNIIEKIESVGQIVSLAQNKVMSLSDSINDHKSRISSLHNKDRISLEQSIVLRDKTEKLNTSVITSFKDLMSQIEVSQTAIQEELQTINTTVAQHRLDVEELIMKQNAFIKNMSDVTVKAFNSIKSEIQLIFNGQNEEYISLKSQMERILYESIGAKQSMSQKWDQFNKLMNDMRIEQIKDNTSFQNSTSDIINKLNEATVSNQEFKNKITLKVDEFSDRIVSEEKAGLENIDSIDDLNTKNTQQIMDNLNQIDAKNTLFANETKAMITQREELIANELKESIQMNDDVIKTTDKQLNAKRIAVTEMSQKLTDELEEQKALVSSINENIENITECVSDKTSEMIRMATTMQNSYVREIDHRFKDFEKFVKNDLIKDIPTGTTPQKTQYSYPRDLVQTSPHERILERFRLTLDPNDAINISLPEETDSEFLSDCSHSSEHSSSSVTSNANNENIKPLTTNTKGTKARFGLKVKSNSDLKKQLECDPIDALDKKITSNCNKDNTKKVSPNLSTKPMPLKTNYTN